MKIVNSVCVIVFRDNKILLVKENKASSPSVNGQRATFVGLPGGKQEKDETLEQAAAKELLEEAGAVATKIGSVVYTIQKDVPSENFCLNTTVMMCEIEDAEDLQSDDPDGSIEKVIWADIPTAISMIRRNKDISRTEPLIELLENGVCDLHYRYKKDAAQIVHFKTATPFNKPSYRSIKIA